MREALEREFMNSRNIPEHDAPKQVSALDLVRRLRAAGGRMSLKNPHRALLDEAAQAVEQLAVRLAEAEAIVSDAEADAMARGPMMHFPPEKP